MYATKIKMKNGSSRPYNLLEIDEIYIEGCNNPGFFKKASIYDFLKTNPDTIKVKLYPYPNIVPAISSRGEKYVRSSPNNYGQDNLLALPRE